ncbi:MAG: MFS transporter [Chloroflexota bacterium]
MAAPTPANPKPEARPSSDGVFYGWYIVAAAAAIAFVAWGVAFWQVGVFLNAFHTDRGWSRTALSGAATVFSLLAGLTGLVAGRAVDRAGPRNVLIAGGATIGTAVFALGCAQQVWHVYAANALLALGYGCIHVVVLSALVARWFRRQRVYALSLALTGSSVGGLVLVPLSLKLIAGFGIQTAATALALIAWAVVLPAAVLVVRDSPSIMGLEPDGERRLSTPSGSDTEDRIWTLREAVRTRIWWTISLAFTLTLMGQVGYLVHQVSVLTAALGVGVASAGVAITTLCGIAGRFVMGWLANLIGKQNLAMLCCLLQAIGVSASVWGTGALVLLAGAAAVGLTIGIAVALHPLMIGDRFGTRSHGTVYGPAFLMTQIGQATGPLVIGSLADLSGGYQVPFTVMPACVLAAIVLLLIPAGSPIPAGDAPARSVQSTGLRPR